MEKSVNKWVRFSRGELTMENVLLLSSLFSIALTLTRLQYTGKPVFLFLIWNLALAWIPYAITQGLTVHLQWIENRFKFALAFTAWLLFLPNTFYIITDLFHLEERGNIPLWFDLALLFSFAWNGLLLGVASIRQMEYLVQVRWRPRNEWLFLFPLMFLNAFGIYVGRYLRYNSWDVVNNPLNLFRDVLHLLLHPLRNRFDWSMIVCYAMVMTIIYISIKRVGDR